MKLSLYPCLWLAGGLLLTGCGKNSSSSSPSTNTSTSSGSLLRAPADYISSLGNAQNRAVSVVDTTSLTQAIQMFNVNEGRYPKDLNELVTAKLIGEVPYAPRGKKLDYNPETGEVKVVDQ